MEELCSVCLCSGRNLKNINDTNVFHCYMQILNEIPVFDISQLKVQVCWECKALMMKLQAFKSLVKRSYHNLMECVYKNVSQKSLIKISHLHTQSVVNFSYPESKIKVEPDDLTADNICTIDNGIIDHRDYLSTEIKLEAEHSEPVTFVKDLTIDKRKKKKDKTKKDKTTRKKHPKLKRESKKKSRSAEIENNSNGSKWEVDIDMESVTKTEDMRCEECDLVFSGSEEFNSHLDNVHVLKVTKKKESKSKVKTKTKKSKNIKPNETEDVNCNGSEWDDDIDRDSATRMEDMRCEECDIVFSEREDFNNHLDSVHVLKVSEVSTDIIDEKKSTIEERPVCVECGKVFSSRKTLRYHRNVIHKGENKHPCPRCGKVYQWKSNLGRHMRSHKARDSDELYCEKCDKRFASVATYRQHLKLSRRHITENEFNFVCNECGKKFVSKTRLRDHIDWDHLKKIKFRCQLCNKPFKCHTSLYIHMQNVHANKEKKDNLCHVCGKSYQNAAKLKYHIVALHSGATPYRCPQCDAAFGWYSSLYRHLREVHYKMKVQPNKKCKKLKKVEPSFLINQQNTLPIVPVSVNTDI